MLTMIDRTRVGGVRNVVIPRPRRHPASRGHVQLLRLRRDELLTGLQGVRTRTRGKQTKLMTTRHNAHTRDVLCARRGVIIPYFARLRMAPIRGTRCPARNIYARAGATSE